VSADVLQSAQQLAPHVAAAGKATQLQRCLQLVSQQRVAQEATQPLCDAAAVMHTIGYKLGRFLDNSQPHTGRPYDDQQLRMATKKEARETGLRGEILTAWLLHMALGGGAEHGASGVLLWLSELRPDSGQDAGGPRLPADFVFLPRPARLTASSAGALLPVMLVEVKATTNCRPRQELHTAFCFTAAQWHMAKRLHICPEAGEFVMALVAGVFGREAPYPALSFLLRDPVGLLQEGCLEPVTRPHGRNDFVA
jgi:hypothetical protein